MRILAFDYKIWADDRTLQAITQIDQGQFAEIHSFVLQQLNHMVIVEELFKSRLMMSPDPHQSTNTERIPAYEELRQRLRASGAWFRDYAARLEEDSARLEEDGARLEADGEMRSFRFADGRQGSMTIGEILFHIVNHGTYHRGNIAHALDRAGVAHPADGYGIYIHEQEPERRQIQSTNKKTAV